MSFKTAIQAYGKELDASFVYGGVRYSGNQIVSMTPHYDGQLFSTVMRCLDIQLDGVKELPKAEAVAMSDFPISTVAIAGRAVAGVAIAGTLEVDNSEPEVSSIPAVQSVRFGVKAPDETQYSYKEYGTYIIKESKYDDESSALNLECYDLMIQSMIPYDLTLEYPVVESEEVTIEEPELITVKDLLDAICDRFGWTKGYSTFTNSGVVIDEEKFDTSYTFRDVLDQIAQVAAGVIAFKNDALCVLYPTASGETIDPSNLQSLTIGEKYGPINSVVLSRSPQEDNIYAQDADSVETNGLTEVRIENNEIMDSHREDFIDAILDRLNGLQFHRYELQSFGIGYLDLCDIFTLETLDGSQYDAIMLVDELRISQSLTENCRFETPEATETDYEAASTTDKLLNKTILKVDKQAQEITAIVSRAEKVESDVDVVSDQVTKMAEVMMDAESVEIKISTAIEGIDSVTTSTGYTFDEDGLTIAKDGEEMKNKLDNTGMYVTRDDEEILTANNQGVSAVNLTSRQYLIVGDNSRFENYNNGTDDKRTACFWIGGGE